MSEIEGSSTGRHSRPRWPPAPCCPRCECERVVRWGRRAGRQRFRCLGCERTFNELTGSPAARSKLPELWPAFYICMVEGLTLHQCARRLGIHPATAWRWRHRVLAALRRRSPPLLEGVIETTDGFFPRSEKGRRDLGRAPFRGGERWWIPPDRERVWVAFARDRTGNSAAEISGATRPKPDFLNDVLLPRLTRVQCLLGPSGPYGGYARFCKQAGITYVRVSSMGFYGRSDRPHRENVRTYERRLRRWLHRFRGVSTRYLAHYLEWHRFLDMSDPSADTPRELLESRRQG